MKPICHLQSSVSLFLSPPLLLHHHHHLLFLRCFFLSLISFGRLVNAIKNEQFFFAVTLHTRKSTSITIRAIGFLLISVVSIECIPYMFVIYKPMEGTPAHIISVRAYSISCQIEYLLPVSYEYTFFALRPPSTPLPHFSCDFIFSFYCNVLLFSCSYSQHCSTSHIDCSIKTMYTTLNSKKGLKPYTIPRAIHTVYYFFSLESRMFCSKIFRTPIH